MNMVYEGFLSPTVGGGARHFGGISAALSRQGARVTEMLPRPTAVPGDTGSHERVYLPVVGPRLMRMAIYETLRVLLLLWWGIRGRRFDVWMARYSLLGIGLGLARLVAKRVVVEINGPVYEVILANLGSRWAAAIALRTMRLQIRSAHAVVAVTPALADYVRAQVPGSAVIAVHNGADTLGSIGRSVAERDVCFVFAGALTRWYELDVVLRAIACMRNGCNGLRVRLVGDGVQRNELHWLVDELGLQDVVEFVGWVGTEQVRRELTRARIGLLPLRAKGLTPAIGSPLKLYEYVAAGLPVVGTALDGIANSPVADAVYYYEQGSVRSCAEALRRSLNATLQTMVDPDAWSWDSRARQLLNALQGESRHENRQATRVEPILEEPLPL